MSEKRSAVFLGTMNAMPMAYALELKSRGWSVKYFVDSGRDDRLSRPEYKFPRVTYPYPDWVIERTVISQMVPALLPAILLRDLVAALRSADVVFLSGLYLCMARFAHERQQIVFLSYGSDLDVWCNRDNVQNLSTLFEPRFGRWLAEWITRTAVYRMIENLRNVDIIATFPRGLSSSADKVLDRELAGSNVRRVARYDISFSDLPDVMPELSGQTRPLHVICGTRHTFRSHPGLADAENKGTDIIIRGLSEYLRRSGNKIVIHFFEKGLDLAEAKAMCRQHNLVDSVVWHGEMRFQEFLNLHLLCDVAFDQVGTHFVGTGMYAMYMGIPVIANGRPDVLQRHWGETSPICQAETEGEIADWLQKLEDAQVRYEIGIQSKKFASAKLSCARTTDAIIDCLDSLH